MNSFTFYSPTKVIFGKDAELHAAREIREFGGTKVMVIYGGGSVVKAASLTGLPGSWRTKAYPI